MPVLAVVCLVLATVWAKRGDPYRRIEFNLSTAHYGKVKAIAVLPKPDARFPVVIYLHGWTGSLMNDGKTLRQFAELGLAAVGIEYDQTNAAAFDEQFLALQKYVQRQPWAQSNAVAWVGMSLGAQRTLRFLLEHPDVQPQLYVRLSGGWDEELTNKFQFPSANSQESKGASPASFKFPVLLVHSDNDATFPLDDTKRLAALLETNGVSVKLRVLSGAGHDFGEDRSLLYRETAEYCRAHLPMADYTATLRNCTLNDGERERFNLAMQRAGQHRLELWKAVASSSEPERHTVMMVIGGLEDYDLAHASASYLKKNVELAWLARRKYPWCRDVPLDVFEKFVANPRFFSEPITDWRGPLNRMVQHEVKYCRTTQEASDRIWKLVNERVVWGTVGGIEPLKILASGKTDCLGLCITHAALGRAAGLPERVTGIIWQNSLPLDWAHFCAEIWSAQDQRWHEIDVSADDRAFDNDWIMRVPKTAILGATGDRGVWDGLSVGRWRTFTNTIQLVYPSGDVSIKVSDGGIPAPDRTVAIQLPTVKGLVYMALARTDENGEARLTLGRSEKFPYLFFVLPPDEAVASGKYPFHLPNHQFGQESWQWVQVEAGKKREVILDLKERHPFDPDTKPPALEKSGENSSQPQVEHR